MKTIHTAIVAALLSSTLAFAVPASAQQMNKQDGLEGTWALQSIYEENDGGEDLDRWGSRPTGHFIADASGHFLFQLVGRDAIKVAGAASLRSAGSDREALAYAGRYQFDRAQGVIKLSIDDAALPDWDGTHPTASITIEGNRLEFVSSAETSPSGSFYSHLVWKRVN